MHDVHALAYCIQPLRNVVYVVYSSGVFSVAFMLPPGIYTYIFCVDGNWQTDPTNNMVSFHCDGGLKGFI